MWIGIDPAPQSLTPNEQRVCDLMNQGLHYFRIAAMLKISFDACRDIIYEIRKKECIIMGRITNDEWADAYASYKSGTMTQTEIAKKLGITVQSVCQRFKKLSAIETQIFDKPAGTAVAENAPITEPGAAVTEPDKLPKEVSRALVYRLADIDVELAKREQLIEGLKAEIAELEQERETIERWKEANE